MDGYRINDGGDSHRLGTNPLGGLDGIGGIDVSKGAGGGGGGGGGRSGGSCLVIVATSLAGLIGSTVGAVQLYA